jgi:hypothetical protein
MHHIKLAKVLMLGILLGGLAFSGEKAVAGDYPPDYKPSKPAEKGETNVLNRVIAITTYMNDKLTAAGGDKSPMCYRNCLTVSFNDVLKCTESKSTYATSESCEKDASQKMATCDPKCQ